MFSVAIQGQYGSFHDEATRQFFKEQPHNIVCCETFSEVFTQVADGTAQYGVVAVENSLYGSLHETYDRIVAHRFPIVGEIALPIHQQLISFPATYTQDITEIYSHPAALDQCRNFLEDRFPRAELVEFHDTAGAVEHIHTKQLTHAAAIASETAAKLYGMTVITKNIEDEPDNTTRFVVIAKKPSHIPNANKASLILTTSHEPGALYAALGIFATNNCNLTKLESRPIRGEKFRYQFIVDVMAQQEMLVSVIHELEQQHCQVTLLGHYVAATV